MLNRILTMLLLGYVLSAWGAAPDAAPPRAPALELHVERVEGADGGKVYRIASSGTVAAAPDVVWRILTDYGHLPDYVPDLKSARVVSRDGDKVILEQEGAASFLFFSRDIRLVVQVHERAPDRIDIRLVGGDMKVYRCSWELIPVDATGGTRIRYDATIEPKFYVPGIVGTSTVKRDVARMMAAVLLRLDRDEPR
jgi:ribosome-associated toxin RatA of RatAB toxin-antitoxin module